MTDLVDHNGRAFAARSAPAVTEAVALPAPWQERDPAMIGNALTPARMTGVLYDRNVGYLQGWADLADEAREKYPHLHSQLAIREESVVETEFVVVPGEGSNQKAAKRAADAGSQLFAAWKARPEDGWDTWLAQLVTAVYHGRTLHEVLWERLEGETRPVALAKVDNRRLSYACAVDEPEPWALRIYDPDAPGSRFGAPYGLRVDAFHPDKFLVNEPAVRHAQKSREGLFAVLAWWWLFLVWDWRDVMALTEMVGRPPVIGYFSAGGAQADGALQKFDGTRNATPAEVAALRKATQAVSGALRAVLADTTRLGTLDFKIPGGETPLQLAIAKVIDAYTSKAINGVDSISDLKAGARASVEVQERTSNTFWRADCRRTARKLTWVLQRYVLANPARFGAGCPLPVVVPQLAPPADIVAGRAAVDAARAYALDTSEEWVRERLGGVPATAKGQTKMKWPALVAPPTPPVHDAPPVTETPSEDTPAADDGAGTKD